MSELYVSDARKTKKILTLDRKRTSYVFTCRCSFVSSYNTARVGLIQLYRKPRFKTFSSSKRILKASPKLPASVIGMTWKTVIRSFKLKSGISKRNYCKQSIYKYQTLKWPSYKWSPIRLHSGSMMPACPVSHALPTSSDTSPLAIVTSSPALSNLEVMKKYLLTEKINCQGNQTRAASTKQKIGLQLPNLQSSKHVIFKTYK